MSNVALCLASMGWAIQTPPSSSSCTRGHRCRRRGAGIRLARTSRPLGPRRCSCPGTPARWSLHPRAFVDSGVRGSDCCGSCTRRRPSRGIGAPASSRQRKCRMGGIATMIDAALRGVAATSRSYSRCCNVVALRRPRMLRVSCFPSWPCSRAKRHLIRSRRCLLRSVAELYHANALLHDEDCDGDLVEN